MASQAYGPLTTMELPGHTAAFMEFVAEVFEWLAEYMDGSQQVSSLDTKDCQGGCRVQP